MPSPVQMEGVQGTPSRSQASVLASHGVCKRELGRSSFSSRALFTTGYILGYILGYSRCSSAERAAPLGLHLRIHLRFHYTRFDDLQLSISHSVFISGSQPRKAQQPVSHSYVSDVHGVTETARCTTLFEHELCVARGREMYTSV